VALRPRLLDLFCGAGGAAMGYHRAGFEVVGVDIVKQPHYPFEFHQANVFEWLPGPMFPWKFQAIHASPPCQDHMQTPHKKHGTGWMLGASRNLLSATGLPWVIENVPGADMRADYALCGCYFGLELRRLRLFETSWGGSMTLFTHNHTGPVVSVTGHGTPSWVRKQLGYNPTIAMYRAAMGIDWMNRNELSQAIPPAYTEWIGKQLMEALKVAA
jgi:DNA (cytosine-5)-methyltransferase 1